VGHLQDISSPLRIIATSIAPLDELAAQNRFRPDLACALSTVAIQLPPLSHRREDIPLLAQAFLEEQNAHGAKQLRGFSPEALDQLAAYPWPGNIDELAAAVREAHSKAEGHQVVPADLPQRIFLAVAARRLPRREPQPIDLESFLWQIERELIERALRLAKGNKTKAARMLKLTRPRLYRRMVQLGFEDEADAASDDGPVADE
jgi:DNA-binding NtrC family response regulator